MKNTRHSGESRTPGRDSQGRFTSGNRNGSNSNRNRRNDGYYNLRYHEDENRNQNHGYYRPSRDNYNDYDNYDERYDNRRDADYDDYENQRGGDSYSMDWDDRRRGYRGGWASYDEPSYERDRNDTYDRDEDRSRYYGSEGRRGFDDHREFDDRHLHGSSNWINDEENSNRGRGFASMDKDELREISAKGGRASHRGSGSSGKGKGHGRTKTSYSQRTASLRRSNRSRNKSH